MNKYKGSLSILIPGATVFFSSGCIMTLELVAARLIARHLGSSLYTWTSVIGVILAGITIGNYLGGRIADRFGPRKALAVLFGICSAACVAVVVLNNLTSRWIWLWRLSWPVHVFSNVSLVFLLPSVLLGTISPVVAKMALDRGLPRGRTVGDIYAWGAAGSVGGTFLAGFYLIAAMGTVAIIWTIGGTLLLMAILYWARLWVLYLWSAIFIALMTMAMASADWAKSSGAGLALREIPSPRIIYEDETQYCCVSVKRILKRPDKRVFMLDKLIHSNIIMERIDQLQSFYMYIYGAVTHGLSAKKDKLTSLIIGGGGYVYPRYVEKNWPGSHIDVVEIDPGVTEAAIEAFGLERDTTINTITMDARNYVDRLLNRECNGEEIPRYDFIYEDTFNDYSIPYQLVTREFNDKIAQILTDDGVYMVTVIDIFDSGRFLGAIFNTLRRTFPNVYVLSQVAPRNVRNTFVVVAAKQDIDIEGLIRQYCKDINLWYMGKAEIDTLKQKSRELVLTDDYAPVENMLAPVVRRSAADILREKIRDRARALKH
ncbi:MAG: fused MFS/spermidine synthase [Desulfobacteraceae bacterium]|nr:fused MFS/spermidine synthase [Desulfobacteraceae bacterium]